MREPVNLAIIFYSSTGNVYRLAQAVAEGGRAAGAAVRLRRVRELAPASAVERNERWAATAVQIAAVPEAALDDLEWSDAVLFGTPTRYGGAASQLKQFIDTTGPLWQQGALADKVYGAFTSTATPHGGQESTLLSLSNVFYHWGGIIVPPGFTSPIQFQLGNPYGVSHTSGRGEQPGDTELSAARYQAQRAVQIATALKRGRRLDQAS
jgi:NAD(P)H dehydrogenase (quinone)